MDERTILRRAKEELVARGLHKGGFCANDDLTGPVCMAGAINLVVTGDPYESPYNIRWLHANELLLAHLPDRDPIKHRHVPGFSDWPTTTLEDAIAVFDRAIASLPTEPSPQEERVVSHA